MRSFATRLAGITILLLISAHSVDAQDKDCGKCWGWDPCVLGCPVGDLEDCGPCWDGEPGQQPCIYQRTGCSPHETFSLMDPGGLARLTHGFVDVAAMELDGFHALSTSERDATLLVARAELRLDGRQVLVLRQCDGALVGGVYTAAYIAAARHARERLML